MNRYPDIPEAEQQAAAVEVIRREALRFGRGVRDVLSLVRLNDPPTPSENLLMAAVRLLRSPHAIMPHKCETVEEWTQRWSPGKEFSMAKEKARRVDYFAFLLF